MVGHRKSQRSGPRIDGKKRRQTRFEYVHVMVDDHSRLAYAEILPTLTASCAVAFLRRAVAWFAQHGVQVKAVMTDNGPAYYSHAHRRTVAELGLKHLRTKPYRPRTNGKAERFIQTLLNEWAYERIYGNEAERIRALPLFLQRYNYHRPHGALRHQTPGLTPDQRRQELQLAPHRPHELVGSCLHISEQSPNLREPGAELGIAELHGGHRVLQRRECGVRLGGSLDGACEQVSDGLRRRRR
jgi:hypothetical protein